MGCDIHLHAEVRINGVWHTLATPDVRRNYRLFARMAGVRNHADMGITPIAEPRGIPDDASVATKHHVAYHDCDGHSHSWLSAIEIALLDETRDEWDYPPNSDGAHDAFMRSGCCDLFGYLYGNTYSGWSKYPEDRVEGIEDVRFVFWFDN